MPWSMPLSQLIEDRKSWPSFGCQVVGSGHGMCKFVRKRYKPSHPIGGHPLWPCPLRVVRNFVRRSYLQLMICLIIFVMVVAEPFQLRTSSLATFPVVSYWCPISVLLVSYIIFVSCTWLCSIVITRDCWLLVDVNMSHNDFALWLYR